MNIFSASFKFLDDTFITPIFGYIFKPQSTPHPSEELQLQSTTTAVVVGGGRPDGGRHPLQGTAQVPNCDAGYRAHVAIDVPHTQPDSLQSVTSAASSESAAAQPSHRISWPVQPQPPPADTRANNHVNRLPNGDAGDRAHVAIDMPDTASESAAAQPSHRIRRPVQPQPPPADTRANNHVNRLPNGDAGYRAHVAIDIPDTQPDGLASVTSESDTAQPSQPVDTRGNNGVNRLPKRIYFMFGAYLTTMEVSLQAIQTMNNAPELLHRSQFQYCLMFLVIALLYLTAAAFSVPAALVLELVAVLFFFLAFIMVITASDVPREVVQVALATFVGSLFLVSLFTYLWRRWGHGVRFSR